MRILSYGGGVQSTAVLVLAASGRIEADAVLFCDVGEDSENPGTVTYVRDVAQPYAAEHGLTIEVLQWRKRDGSQQTVLGKCMSPARTVPIPVRMSNGAPGRRSCTVDFKIKQAQAWAKRHGATADNPASMLLGISVDEAHRARGDSGCAWTVLAYPLLDLRLTRNACLAIITDAGLPVPDKSACWFCPFHTPAMWREMRAKRPEMFAAAVELEAHLNAKRGALGKDQVWLTRFGRPLAEAIPEGGQIAMDGFDACENGWCWT